MSFIGMVTRKEKNTGVTLRAKIVTPSKNKSITKDFPVKVKAQEADDLWCCYTDSATAKALLERMRNEDESINVDLPFHTEGKNGTTLTYKLSDGLEKYIDDSGMLNAPPKFGEPDVSGNILITASKNDQSVSVRVNVVIKSIRADDILYNPLIFNEDVIWNLIKAKADTAVNTSKDALIYDLNLKNSYTLKEILTAQQVTKKDYVDITKMITEANAPMFEWTIENSDTNTAIINLLKADGTLKRPSYKEACNIYDNATDKSQIQSDDTMVAENAYIYTRFILFKGYVVKATISLKNTDGYTRIISIPCNVKSHVLTNEEMVESVVSECISGIEPILYVEGFKIKNTGDSAPDGGIEQHFYASDTSNTENERTVTLKPGEIYCIRTINNGNAGILKSEELHFIPEVDAPLYSYPSILKVNNLNVANVFTGYTVNEDGSLGSVNANDTAVIKKFKDNIQIVDNGKYQMLEISYDTLNLLNQNPKRIKLQTNMSILHFATDNTKEEGSEANIQSTKSIYVQFVFNLVPPEETEEPSVDTEE